MLSDTKPLVLKIGGRWRIAEGPLNAFLRPERFRTLRWAHTHAGRIEQERRIKDVLHQTLSGMPDYNTIKENP